MARRKWYKQPMSKWLPYPNRSRVRRRAFKLELQHIAGALASPLKLPMAGNRTAAMVRSPMSVPTATIGAVRLVALTRATSPSAAAMPSCSTTTERTASLCVASRIDTKRSVSVVEGLPL